MTNQIDPTSTETQVIGYIPQSIIDYYSLKCLSAEVFLPPGVLKHLKKRGHWDDFMKYYEDIPAMIALPDYVGQNPKEPHTIEIYKVIADHVILPIKLNEADGMFMSSFYILDNGADKIAKRLRIGRLFPFSHFSS